MFGKWRFSEQREMEEARTMYCSFLI